MLRGYAHSRETEERTGLTMFTDRAKVFIKSGDGGNGHISFRRELYVANGGPDGGDGGKGGDIIFEVDDGLNTLVDFRHVRKYVAQSGEEGGKRRCHGANGNFYRFTNHSILLKLLELSYFLNLLLYIFGSFVTNLLHLLTNISRSPPFVNIVN